MPRQSRSRRACGRSRPQTDPDPGMGGIALSWHSVWCVPGHRSRGGSRFLPWVLPPGLSGGSIPPGCAAVPAADGIMIPVPVIAPISREQALR